MLLKENILYQNELFVICKHCVDAQTFSRGAPSISK